MLSFHLVVLRLLERKMYLKRYRLATITHNNAIVRNDYNHLREERKLMINIAT